CKCDPKYQEFTILYGKSCNLYEKVLHQDHIKLEISKYPIAVTNL
ncbi:MAG: hypothetical protein RIR48_1451, partial [Bacteroidota bacterium]